MAPIEQVMDAFEATLDEGKVANVSFDSEVQLELYDLDDKDSST